MPREGLLRSNFSSGAAQMLNVAVSDTSAGRYTVVNNDDGAIAYSGAWNRSTGRNLGDYKDDVQYTEGNGQRHAQNQQQDHHGDTVEQRDDQLAAHVAADDALETVLLAVDDRSPRTELGGRHRRDLRLLLLDPRDQRLDRRPLLPRRQRAV